MERKQFVLGSNGSFFFNAPSRWAHANLPKEMREHFSAGVVAEVQCAAWGDDPESYFFLYTKKVGSNTVPYVCWGDRLPAALDKWLFDENKKLKREHNHTQVVLGPNGSFFAWDTNSVRWQNVPEDLEEAVQSWLSPAGWKFGPPRIVTLGYDGAFFALSQYGMPAFSIPESQAMTAECFRTLQSIETFEWRGIEKISFNPYVPDNFVIVFESTYAVENLPKAARVAFRRVFDSFATETIRKTLQEQWAAQDKQEAEEEAKAEAARKEKATLAELKTHYEKWRSKYLAAFSSTELLLLFPHIPDAACLCNMDSCKLRKTDSGLLACRHDVESILRASGQYSLAWLRTERLAWHPDKIGRKCHPSCKVVMQKKATEMYAIFEELIASEMPV